MILPSEGDNGAGSEIPAEPGGLEGSKTPDGIGSPVWSTETERPEGGPPVAKVGGYSIRLDSFEGPLDLLLYLIQRDEIDIYDIPIASITQTYLEFIEDLDQLDLETAGEFLVMASTLMRIKARLLLPVQRSDEEDDGEDPRDELVRRLLEYKKFKEASQALSEAEQKRREIFSRSLEYPFRDQIPEDPPEFSLSLFDLLGSVKNVLDQIKGDHQHHVYQEIFTVEEQARKLTQLLYDMDGVRLEDVFSDALNKMEVVVTFVAMLELMKQGRVLARQVGNYQEIRLYRGEMDGTDKTPSGGGSSQEANHAA